jgi:hypothetical protein
MKKEMIVQSRDRARQNELRVSEEAVKRKDEERDGGLIVDETRRMIGARNFTK